MFRMRHVMMGLAVAALAVGAGAEAPAADDYAEYVVTAWREPQEVRKTGLSVTVISEKDIERSGAPRVMDLLYDVPGLHVMQSGSQGSLTQVYVRGGTATSCLVLIDGVKVNENDGGYDWANLLTDNIERIEIIRGPASVVYGGDAGAGVIQIFTKKGRVGADGRPQYALYGEAGSFSTFREGATAQGATDRTDWSLGVEQFNTGGHLPVNNAFAITAADGRFHVDASDRTSLTLTGHYADRRYEIPTDNGGDLLPPFLLDPDNYTRNTISNFGINLQQKVNDRFDVTIEAGRYVNTIFDRDQDNGAVDPWGYWYREEEFKRQTGHLRGDYRWGSWLWSAGTEIEGEEIHGVSDAAGWPTLTDMNRTNYAGYLTVAAPLIKDRLDFTLGGRYDDNTRMKQQWSGRGSLAWQIPSTRTTIRAAGGSGYTNPSLLEVASNFATFLPNPALRGEQERTWEVGVDQRLVQEKVQVSATWFNAYTKDYIQNVAVGALTQPQNLGRARRYGVEAQADWFLTPRWTLSGNYTWLRSKVTDMGSAPPSGWVNGQPLPRRPNHTGSAILKYTSDRWRGEVRFTGVSSARDLDWSGYDQWNFVVGNVRVPGYCKLDLSLEYDVLRNLTVTARGTNVLDKRYQEVYGFSAPGAGWYGGLRWTF